MLFTFLYGQPGRAHENMSDGELIEKYRNGEDPGPIGVLFDRYIHLVYGVCLRYLKDPQAAEDAAMEVFESLFTLLKKHSVGRFPPWIHRVTTNHCLMILRRAKNRDNKKMKQFEENTDAIFMENDAFMHPLNEENHIPDVVKAMEQLKDEQKICLRLFYFEQKSYRDVAGITGMDIKKVKSHIQNGKRNLKMILEQNHEKS